MHDIITILSVNNIEKEEKIQKCNSFKKTFEDKL